MKEKIIEIFEKHGGSDSTFPKCIFPGDYEEVADEILSSLVSEDAKTYAEGFSDGLDEALYRGKETDTEIALRVAQKYAHSIESGYFALVGEFCDWLRETE